MLLVSVMAGDGTSLAFEVSVKEADGGAIIEIPTIMSVDCRIGVGFVFVVKS